MKITTNGASSNDTNWSQVQIYSDDLANANGTTLIRTSVSDNFWGSPMFIEAREVGESIEVVYKQISNFSTLAYPPQPPEERVFKIVYSCKDGKWHKSEPIFGKIVPAQSEYYEFEE